MYNLYALKVSPNTVISPSYKNYRYTISIYISLLSNQSAGLGAVFFWTKQKNPSPPDGHLLLPIWAARTKFGFPFQNLALQWFRGDLGTALRMDDMRLDYCEFLLGLQQFCGWLPYISKQYGSCLNISCFKTLNNDATTTASTTSHAAPTRESLWGIGL